jgi:hypothetical protein
MAFSDKNRPMCALKNVLITQRERFDDDQKKGNGNF